MHGPRDTPQLAVPVDPWTGYPLPSVVVQRLHRYLDAEKEFYRTLHELDGSSEGTRPGDRRMMHAFDHLEEAGHWVMACLLDHDKA